MTPREPDRFEAKARELLREIHHGVLNLEQAELHANKVAATLRAAESSALERAAQIADEYDNEEGHPSPQARALIRIVAERIRALIPPAAAPAAETCPEPPPGLVETLEKVHGMGCGNIATQRIPARPSEPAAETGTEPGTAQGPWRVGNHYGIHVYEDQRPVATFLREEDARRCVAAVNAAAPPDEPPAP